jgi:hypothetical protein
VVVVVVGVVLVVVLVVGGVVGGVVVGAVLVLGGCGGFVFVGGGGNGGCDGDYVNDDGFLVRHRTENDKTKHQSFFSSRVEEKVRESARMHELAR